MTQRQQVARQERVYVNAIIADAGSLSGAVIVPDGRSLLAIVIPTGTEGTVLTFEGEIKGDDAYRVMRDWSGAELTLTFTAANCLVPCDDTLFAGLTGLKVRTGTSGAPSPQTGAATLTLTFG